MQNQMILQDRVLRVLLLSSSQTLPKIERLWRTAAYQHNMPCSTSGYSQVRGGDVGRLWGGKIFSTTAALDGTRAWEMPPTIRKNVWNREQSSMDSSASRPACHQKQPISDIHQTSVCIMSTPLIAPLHGTPEPAPPPPDFHGPPTSVPPIDRCISYVSRPLESNSQLSSRHRNTSPLPPAERSSIHLPLPPPNAPLPCLGCIPATSTALGSGR